MASMSVDRKSGRRTIQFVGDDGKRRSIRLGKCPRREAESVKLRVEFLLSSMINKHALDRDTAMWLAEIGDTLHARIAAAGLCEPREQPQATTLGASRSNSSPNGLT